MVTVLGNGGHGRMLAGILRQQLFAVTLLDAEAAVATGDVVIGIGNVVKIGDSGLHRRSVLYNRHALTVIGVIHASAVVLGEYHRTAQLMPRVVVNAGARISANVILNTGCIVEHACVIGQSSHIAPGAVLCGAVTVGEMTHIGAGSVVRQGIAIGSRCVIAMGSVVTRDVPDGATWVGGGLYVDA